MDVLKAIIPAAGLGTRFLPYTKAVPKELLPLLDKPALHYIAEEALATGIKDLLIITGQQKWAISDYFATAPEELELLYAGSKTSQLASLKRLVAQLQFTYVQQASPLGLGHAVWTARNLIGKEYFGVLLPDDLIVSPTPGLLQLLKLARQERASVIAVQEVPRELVSQYGVIEVRKQLTPSLFQVGNLVEKPAVKAAPSNLAIIGRYILSPKLFPILEELRLQTEGSDLQLTDALAQLVRSGEKLLAYKVTGLRYDIGTPLGWIKAVIGMASQDPRYAQPVREFIGSLDSVDSFVYNQQRSLVQQT